MEHWQTGSFSETFETIKKSTTTIYCKLPKSPKVFLKAECKWVICCRYWRLKIQISKKKPKSNPSDQWSSRHLIRVVRKPAFWQLLTIFTILTRTPEVINKISWKSSVSPNLPVWLGFAWVVDEKKYDFNQSEAASHTMRHLLSLPLILFPLALTFERELPWLTPTVLITFLVLERKLFNHFF